MLSPKYISVTWFVPINALALAKEMQFDFHYFLSEERETGWEVGGFGGPIGKNRMPVDFITH